MSQNPSRAPETSPTVPAVLVGLDTLQGLQSARILARRGVAVIALARNRQHHACHTRVCQQIIYSDTDGDGLIDALCHLGPTLSGKAVLYPCSDRSVVTISRAREQLAPWFIIMLAPADVIDTLSDKVRFSEFAERNGLAVPRTIVLRGPDDVARAAQELTFPVVIKPTRRTRRWDTETASKVFRVEEPAALAPLVERIRDWADSLIVQEWVEGTDSDLYSCNVYFGADARPLVTFVARKLRQWPPRVGSSSSGEECRNDAVRDEAIRIFTSCNYRGLGYVEMKRDRRSGEHFIMEVNPGRPTGRSAITEGGGVPLLYTMYCDAVGLPLPDGREQRYTGAKWVDLRHDFQSALRYRRDGELSLIDWWRSLRGRRVYAVFSWSDPLPFLWDLWRVVKVAFSPAERARRKRPA